MRSPIRPAAPAVSARGGRLFPLAAAIILSAKALAAQGATVSSAPGHATPRLAFSFNDQFGKRWTADSFSGRWTVLLAGERKHSDNMKAWSDSLYRALAGDSATVHWFMVADLRRVPRMMQRLANQRAPREAHRRLLMDGDGTIARQLALPRGSFSMVLLSPSGVERMRLVDSTANTRHLAAVLKNIEKP